MPSYEIWDVAFVPAFPNQENRQHTTSRPAVIIDDLQDKVIICPLTKQIHQQNNYRYTVEVDVNSPEGQAMGLDFTSIIVLDRTAELRKVVLGKKIGTCPPSVVDQIESLLEQKRQDGQR